MGSSSEDLNLVVSAQTPNEAEFTGSWDENVDTASGAVIQLVGDYPGSVTRGKSYSRALWGQRGHPSMDGGSDYSLVMIEDLAYRKYVHRFRGQVAPSLWLVLQHPLTYKDDMCAFFEV